MNINEITSILKRLQLEDSGRYENHFYIINLKNSDEYARLYTQLDTLAINTEYPSFETNTNKSTTKIINYFEIEEKNILFNIFLIADFNNDSYYIKIGEK